MPAGPAPSRPAACSVGTAGWAGWRDALGALAGTGLYARQVDVQHCGYCGQGRRGMDIEVHRCYLKTDTRTAVIHKPDSVYLHRFVSHRVNKHLL